MFGRYSSFFSFLDILFNMMLIFAVAFVMSIILIQQENKKSEGNIEAKAEFILSIDWDPNSRNDVDLWLKLPNEEVIFFRKLSSKQLPIYLERDDLGDTNDITVNENGKPQVVLVNREVITFRAIVPGDFTVNIHGYNLTKSDKKSEKVKVSLIRVNPYQLVLEKELELVHAQEITVWSFHMSDKGYINGVNNDPVPMVYKK